MSLTYWEENYRKYPAADAGDGWLSAHARELIPGSRVLDLGCGTGTNIPDLLKLGAQLSVADLSENAVSSVRSRFGEALVSIDCFDMRFGLPYEDDSFDAVVADLSLHYFSWAETRKIIAEIRRTLNGGGRLIARLHALENLEQIPPQQIEDHYYIVDGCARRYFTVEEVEELFSEWEIPTLQKKEIRRYGRIKHVLEFIAQRR